MRASQLHIAGNLSADHVSHTDAGLPLGARQRSAHGKGKVRSNRLNTGEKGGVMKRSTEGHPTWNAVSSGGHGLLWSREILRFSIWTII